MPFNIVDNGGVDEIQVSGTESTATLLADATVGTNAGVTVAGTTITLDGLPITVENGGTFIIDDEEGIINTNSTIIARNGGQLDIGRFTADFESTGVAKQTSGTGWYSTGNAAAEFNNSNLGQFLNGSTVNWYATVQTSSGTAFLNIQGTCDMNWFGGSRLISTAPAGGTNAGRIRQSSTTAVFDGSIAGTTDEAPFTCVGPVRIDFFQDVATANGGGYTCEYSSGGAFQVVNVGDTSQEFVTIPGLGNVGLIENFVGDAFGGSGVKIRNASSAARYNVSHNQNSGFGATSYTFMTQDISDTIIDVAGNPIENAFFYISDNGGDAVDGGTDQDDRTIASPTVFGYRNTNIIDPVFGGALSGGSYTNDIVYSGLSNASGLITDEIVTRLLIGGRSGGQSTDGTAYTDDNTATNYRFTTDNNDTGNFIIAAYGQDRLNYSQNLVGLGVPTSFDRQMSPDAIITATGIDNAAALAGLSNTSIDSLDLAIAVIEHNHTPQSANDTAALFRYFANGDKAWSSLTDGNVVFRDLNVTMNTGPNGITVGGNTIGAGMASVLTGGSLGLNLGNRTYGSNVTGWNNSNIIAADINLTSSTGVSNITVNGATAFTANPNGGVSIEGSASGLTSVDGLTFVSNPTVALGTITDITADMFTGSFRFTGSGSVNIIETQRVQLGLADQDTQTINGITYNRVVPVVDVTLSPGVSESFLQENLGYWIVTDASGAIIDDITITNTTTLADVTFARANNIGDTFTGKYQPLSSLTGGDTFDYGEEDFTPTGGSVTVTPRNDTALTTNTTVDRTSLVTITTSGSGNTFAIEVVYDITDSTIATIAQELALVVRNDKSYIDAIVARGYTTAQPILEYQQPFTTAYNGIVGTTLPTPLRSVYTLTPTDAATGQVALSRTIGYITGRTATNNVGFFSPDLINVSATLDQVTAAQQVTIDQNNLATRQHIVDLWSLLVNSIKGIFDRSNTISE